MSTSDPNQFLGLPACALADADVAIVPLPLEKTVSYGTGTWRAPRAILDASCQVETFDEETLVDFAEAPKIHTMPLLLAAGSVEDYLHAVRERVSALRGKFVLALGGEHTVTYGVVTGLVEDPAELTVVQIDAHADLIDELDGQHWSHGTVMRRLWERGCQVLQVGIRSLSRSEYELAAAGPRIATFYAHQVAQKWPQVIAMLRDLRGKVYLTLDVDGLDPAVIPSTGTPQPNGLSWTQAVEVIQAVTAAPQCQLVGADVVELIASPHLPGCDLTAAKLAAKILAFWWKASYSGPGE